MNAYDVVVKKAIEAADQIKDADAKVHAYCCILGFVKEKDVKLEKEAVSAAPAKESRKAKAAEAKSEEKGEAKPESKTKPLEMKQPDAKTVKELELAVKEIEEEPITLPADDDNEEKVALRRALVAKKYGGLSLKEAYSNAEVAKYITREVEALSAFRLRLMEAFDVRVDENDNQIGESGFGVTKEQVDGLIHHYIKEADKNAKDYGEVKLDKFLLVYIPYMIQLYEIYGYKIDDIIKAGNTMMQLTDGFTAANININNAGALVLVLRDLDKHNG